MPFPPNALTDPGFSPRDFCILVVDDEASNCELLQVMLHAQGYTTRTAPGGEEALRIASAHRVDLALLDVMMPGMDGYALALAMKALPSTRNVPIIFTTSLDDRSAKMRALESGAEEFITKPFDRIELMLRVRNLLRLKAYQDLLAGRAEQLGALVDERTRELNASYIDTLSTLTRAAEYKDQETGDHVLRVSLYTRALAEAIGMDAGYCDRIFHASPMHDVGKIAIPDRILLKPGSFLPDEWETMKTHAALGAEILRVGRSPYLAMGAEIAEGHHERWDGTGYPHGLAGEAIPLCARIMQICDVYDALRSARPYKTALSHARSIEIITVGDQRTMPQHFDPAVMAAFLRCSDRFCDIFDTDQQAHVEGGAASAPPPMPPPSPPAV